MRVRFAGWLPGSWPDHLCRAEVRSSRRDAYIRRFADAVTEIGRQGPHAEGFIALGWTMKRHAQADVPADRTALLAAIETLSGYGGELGSLATILRAIVEDRHDPYFRRPAS